MKRTVEIVLTSIGSFFSLVGVIMTALLVFFSNTDFVRENFKEGYREGAIEGGGIYDPGEADLFLNIIIGFGWLIFITLLVGFILGIIAIFFYAGNKKPKAASIMMIIAAVVVVLGTIFTGFLPAVLFLIAGILGLVRKPPVSVESKEAEL